MRAAAYGDMVKKSVSVYFDEFWLRGQLHCFKGLRVVDEFAKAGRDFIPLSGVTMFALGSEAPLKQLDYLVLGKRRVRVAVVEEDEIVMENPPSHQRKLVAAFFEDFKVQGEALWPESIRLVDELNKPDASYVELADATLFLSRGENLVKVREASRMVLNKAQIRMLAPLGS